MKIVICGSNGLVGSSIIPYLQEHFEIVGYDIDQWDITSHDRGLNIVGLHKPDVILNLAAITDVDGCEDNQEAAYAINGQGAGTVAALCREAGVRLIHMSTDYVFDGTKTSPYNENDVPNPMSVYGRSKLLGETLVREALPQAIILRAQWIYGRGGRTFVDKVMQLSRENGHVRVVDDQCGSPTYARDIAAPIKALIRNGSYGIYHVSNSGSCTWYEFARAIFGIQNMNVQVIPISSDELRRKARRPAYSVFDMRKLERETNIEMRHWTHALREFLSGKS